jgi:hypothetical protein
LAILSLSPAAILHSRANRNTRNLYGIRHHSGIVEGGSAVIHLPIKNRVEEFEIAVRVAAGGIVELRYNGTIKRVVAIGGPVREILPLNKNGDKHARLELQIKFKSSDGHPIPGEIIQAGFIDG